MTSVYRRSRGHQAVSVVIGVMLMMSILFLAAAQYQLIIVPQQEETTEIEHHRLVSSQMGQLHADILSASSNSAQSAQKLTVGTEYSQDLIFGIIPEVHQPNPTGRISNEDFTNQIVVKNAEGIGSARNYWPGGLDGNECDDPNHCYETTSFHYSAEYNRFTDNPEMVYENTLVYDYYDTDNDGTYDASDDYQFHANQNLVQGRTVNLIALTGNLEQSRVGPATLQTLPISAPAQTITIESDTDGAGDPVSFEIPSRVPASIWETEILPQQMTVNPNTGTANPQGYIENVASCGTNCVEFTMAEGEVYNLKLSRVHLTTREEQTEVPIEKAAYIAWKGNERVTIRENSTTEIQAQVRDRYNNAVQGIQTKSYARDASDNCIGSFRSQHSDAPCDGNQQPGAQTSGEDGTLTYYYVAPDVDADTAISIQLLLDDPDNTVSNNIAEPSPELMDASTSPSVSTFFPSARVGHLNADNTLRVTDVTFEETSVNAKNEVVAHVTFDNTGNSRITRDVTIGGSGGLVADPNPITVDLEPGEHERHVVSLSFSDAGSQTVQFGSHAVSVGVQDPSTGIAPIVIDNRRTKETINKSPGRFKDGDAVSEFKESPNIPPVEYDPATGQYDGTAVGNLYRFPSIGDLDGNPAYLDGDTSQATRDSLRVGMATDRVADNEVYTLFMNYTFANSANDVRYTIVNSTGTVLDEDSNYYLNNDGGGYTTRAYQLTREEARYLRSSNELYTVVQATDTSGNVPQVRIDRMWLVSGTKTINLSEPDMDFDASSIAASSSSVRTGQPAIISAELENTGTAAIRQQVTLFQSENGDRETVKTKYVYVNPGTTKTVEFIVYESNPGTYDFQMGLGLTADTNNVTVDVTHR